LDGAVTAPPVGRRWLRVGAVVLFVAALAAAFGSSFRGPPPRTTPAVGRPAPSFELPRLDGRRLSSAEFVGRVAVVNFWASWCLPCRDEAPVLQALWVAGRDQGLVVVGVNVWDPPQEARAFVARYGLTFPNGLDRDGRVAIAFGLAGVPETFVLDRSGLVARRFVGPVDPRSLAAELRRLGVLLPETAR
jgi:cytochrome c biogenesis protein CcmG/thiol:disulfide interchange protein DsbE